MTGLFFIRFLYVVEKNFTIVSLTPYPPSTREVIYTSDEAIHCLALGKRGADNVLYFQSAGGRIASIIATSRNQTRSSSVELTRSVPSLKCQYMTMSRQWLLWSNTNGTLLKYDTTTTTASNNSSPEIIGSAGFAHQGIATSSSASLFLYVSNGTEIRSQTLDLVTPSSSSSSSSTSASAAATDALWASFGPSNATRQIITMNNAVLFSTSSGISFVFSPFQPGGTQFIYRQIVTGLPDIRGIVTDAALSLSSCILMVILGVVIISF